MKNTKILISGGNGEQRSKIAETFRLGSEQQGLRSIVTDFEKLDAITNIEIPKLTDTAIFFTRLDNKKFDKKLVGVYTRLITGSRDKLSFVHIEIK